MLNNKQKKFLKKEAHDLKPLFQVGKQGISEELVAQLDDLIEKRELIKVNVLQNANDEVKDIAYELAEALDAELLQVLGRVMTFYRVSTQEKYRKISGEMRKQVKG